MAQLIKLQDYISRYETDLYRYPTQFIRLKKQQWQKIKLAWEAGTLHQTASAAQFQDMKMMIEGKPGIVKKMKGIFKKTPADLQQNKVVDTSAEAGDEGDFDIQVGSDGYQSITSEEELKQYFLDQLLNFQLKWGTSTVFEKSHMDHKYKRDPLLKYFLQRFPDSFLVLYEPIFMVKKARVEMEIILITPTTLWCLTLLEHKAGDVFIGSKEHFWEKRSGKDSSKILNPLISMNRMEKIITNILQIHEVDMPVKKAILSRNGFIDYPAVPYGIELIDKKNYEEWFQQLRNMRSPIKHIQLKAAQALLDFSHTVGFKRLEWKEEREGDLEGFDE
ncbi:NERD domain-containing protein [Falsibacillus albus]|uniref:NERD domain-containing protein n=1 Tax=Falsibacillus albus TaxID=2478915 RepID=A0A3L7K471_9BACI|nr:NERD domain-containing protein [Falsibacillus albus]RLQ97886.1 NERD domain-containing protein [Falsibacillus albus]